MLSPELDWSAFLVAMVILELTPGPNMGWLAALSAQSGKRIGLTAVAGVTLGLLLQLLAAATGLSAVLANIPSLYHVLRWAGVAFMLYLAWEAFADTGSASSAHITGRAGFMRGLIANVLNPKALAFYVLIVGQFADPAVGPVWRQILLLGLVHLGISIVIHTGIVLLASRLGERMDKWRTSFAARLIFAALLTGIAIWIAISTAHPM